MLQVKRPPMVRVHPFPHHALETLLVKPALVKRFKAVQIRPRAPGVFMIVCVCSRVNTQQIQSAISISPTFDDVVLATGACKSCGLCRPEIERLITESTKCPNTGKNDVTT